MSNIKLVPVAKIIEGALNGDLNKVKAYAKLVEDDLKNQGDERGAKIVHNAINGIKSKSVCCLDSINQASK